MSTMLVRPKCPSTGMYGRQRRVITNGCRSSGGSRLEPGAPRPTGEQLAVELGAQLRGMLPGEVRLRVPQYGASHLRPVIEMPQDRVRKGARVAGLEDERRVTGELRRAPRSLTTTGTPAAIARPRRRFDSPAYREGSRGRLPRAERRPLARGCISGISKTRSSSGTSRAAGPAPATTSLTAGRCSHTRRIPSTRTSTPLYCSSRPKSRTLGDSGRGRGSERGDSPCGITTIRERPTIGRAPQRAPVRARRIARRAGTTV